MKKPRKNKNKQQPKSEAALSSPEPAAVPSPAQSAPARAARLPSIAAMGGGAAALELAPAMAEADEPTVSRLTLPVLMIALLGLMVYIADMYLMDRSGGFSELVYYPHDQIPRPPGGPSLYEQGKTVYERKAQCAACHQASGAGSPSQNAPPLAGSDWVVTEGVDRLNRIILHGLTGPIEVSGKVWSGGAMIGWKEILTDEDIAAVLTYIRQSWGNQASDVTPEQVKATRDETAGRTAPWTAPELLRIPEN